MKAGVGQIHYYYDGMQNVASFKVNDITEAPGLTIRSEIKEKGENRRLSVLIEPVSDLVVNDIFLEVRHDFTPGSRIFCNGYQSWTESREFAVHEKIAPLFPGAGALGFRYHGDAFFMDYPNREGRFHGYTWFYVREGQRFDFIGSVTEEQGFTLFEADCGSNRIIIRKDCAAFATAAPYRAFDLVMSGGGEEDVFAEYWKALSIKKKIQPPCTGWSSRHNLRGKITEEVILHNLGAFAERKVPIDVFMVDEGYQAAVGDWLETGKGFPRRMGYLSSLIHDTGYRPGIWIAPFVCEKKSKIFRERRHWLLRDHGGGPCIAGYNPAWGGRFYALDFYNEEVRAYIRRVFEVVLDEWEYEILKLDFIYAAAICPPAGKSRGQVMCEVMKFLRECAGKKEILACALPPGSAFGLADYYMAGSDAGLKWNNTVFSRLGYRERASVLNSLLSTAGRRHLDGHVFRNAAGSIVLREKSGVLTRHEQYTLFMMNNLFGGMIFTSDDISDYPEERMTLYRSMFPLREKHFNSVATDGFLVTVDFSIGGEDYFVFCNLSGESVMAFLPTGTYFTAGYGQGEGIFIEGDMDMELEPHTAQCYLKIPSAPFRIVGSTGHIFPGSEIKTLRVKNRRIRISPQENFSGNDTVYISVPSEGDYYVNDRETRAYEALSGLYMVEASLEWK